MIENVTENFHDCFTSCMEESACLASSYFYNKTCILFRTLDFPIPTNVVTQIKHCSQPSQVSANSSNIMNGTGRIEHRELSQGGTGDREIRLKTEKSRRQRQRQRKRQRQCRFSAPSYETEEKY